jgi:hypothetical protein
MSSNSILDLKTRLARIAKAVAGVKRVYTHAPANLPPGDLPLMCIFTGPGTHNWKANGAEEDSESRGFVLRLYVRPAQGGVVDGEAERAVEPFLEAVAAAFGSRPGLSAPAEGASPAQPPLQYVLSSELQSDSGPVILGYAGNEYLGVEWKLNVFLIRQVSLAKYE